MAQKTEQAIVNALKKLLAKRPLSKITISDIAEECGINRMTFYYHYHDVYDLIECIADEELKGALEGNRTLSDWQEGVIRLMTAILNDKAFYTGLYHSLERDKVSDYIFGLVSELLLEGTSQIPTPAKVTEEERKFIIDFYSYAFCGLLLQWVRDGMKESPELLVSRMSTIGKGELAHGFEVFAEGR